MEELFKSIPVWMMIIFGSRLSSLNIPGYIKNKPNPTIAMIIGCCSAVGFIVDETLGQYVPKMEEIGGLGLGFMILIPRFITGMAGHVGWSGIFAYFIACGFYYKQVNYVYPLVGWILASVLHGLWNAWASNIYFGGLIGVGTFIIFLVYLFKAKNSFPLRINN